MQRLAKAEDVHGLVEMGRKFHAMSPHASMAPYDGEAVDRMLTFMIQSDAAVVIMNDTGVIGAVYAPVYFNPGTWMCEESFWWADKDGGELLAGLEEHAKGWGADFLHLSTLENDKSKAIDRVLTRKGFRAIERRYLKELSP